MTRAEILRWLREDDPAAMEVLWARADAVRRERVGDAVHLRGLVEISNHCARHCAYCGISAANRDLVRYRMTAGEIAACARHAAALGYGTVVLQAGEDYGIGRDWLADVVRRIKSERRLAVTLSLGERPQDDLAAWRAAGADRYLLRFETSDAALYGRIHPPLAGRPSDRFAILKRLADLGYEVGSGVMIGIPGQTFESLAADLELFAGLDLDMIGVGPFIPHPATPLGRGELPDAPVGEQVPNTELMTCKVVALARLVCPDANIPATTALAILNIANGRELGLARGANVVMPNLTPARYRTLYEIYPGKGRSPNTAADRDAGLNCAIERMGRTVGAGLGPRRRRPWRVPLEIIS
jgi:biotin synthase